MVQNRLKMGSIRAEVYWASASSCFSDSDSNRNMSAIPGNRKLPEWIVLAAFELGCSQSVCNVFMVIATPTSARPHRMTWHDRGVTGGQILGMRTA